MEKIEVILKSGYVFIGEYDIDDCDEIHESFSSGAKYVNFNNGYVLASEVAAAKWIGDK